MHLSPGQLTQLRELAEQVAAREGCLLYDLEFAGSSRTLRIFIDKSEGGVGVEDCSKVSRGLNLILDVEDVIPGGAYDLEVSTPGLERKLTQLWHYQKVIGKTVKIAYRDQDGKIQSYDGILQSIAGEDLILSNSKGDKTIGFGNIEKAKLVFIDVKQGKPGKKPAPNKR